MKHSKEQNQRWIDEINKYVQLNDADLIIKMSLSYTLQSLRQGENIKRFQWGGIKMVWSETDKFAYCSFTCPHQDRYNGWCNYYYKDLGEIDEQKCEHIQEVIKEHKRIIGEE